MIMLNCMLWMEKNAIIVLNDEDNINDEIGKYLDSNPDWEGYKIEIISLNQ